MATPPTYDIPPIHGRSSFIADLKIASANVEVDLSGETIYLEIPASKLRILLPIDPSDPNLKRLAFTRAIVEQLPTVPSQYAIVDETDLEFPVVFLVGNVSRNGYAGAPA